MKFGVETKGFDKAKLILEHMPGALQRANYLATQRAITAARAQAVKSARDLYDVKAAELRNSISLNPQLGSMTSRGKPLSLMKFKVTPRSQRQEVVRASVKGSGGAIGYAFVSQMSNGSVGVFKRAGASRYPIRQLYSVSAAQMIGEHTVIEDTSDRAKEVYEERIMHEVNRIMTRY